MNVIEAIQRKKHVIRDLHLAEQLEAAEVRNQLGLQKRSNATIRSARGKTLREEQRLHKEEILSKTKELFERSGLLTGLQRIQQKYLTRFTKHDLLLDYETGEAILVWGNKYDVEDGGIEPYYEIKKKGWLSDEEVCEIDCSVIYIHVNPHSGSIKLSGSEKLNKKAQSEHLEFRCEQQNLRRSEWSNNLDLVSEALATAFLYPVKLKDKHLTGPSPTTPPNSAGPVWTR